MRTSHSGVSILSVIGAFICVAALQSCGKPESADFNFEDVNATGRNNPYRGFKGGDVKGEKNFAELINHFAQGKPKRNPWAGYWWPYKEGGISSGAHGGGYSPAGKYDAARGNQTSAQTWESRFHGPNVKGIQSWWGHCNGWCAASALYPEPLEPVTVNGLEFGISDIKGLLSEAGMSANADFFGNRVDWASDLNTPKADDTVPDQYFLVLTNHMGKLGNTVLIDRYTGDQIWNQPVSGYRFEYPTPEDYLGADPSTPGVYRINLTSTIWWASDEVPAGIQTPSFDFPAGDTDVYASRVLKMEVWLDAPVVFGSDGKITSAGNVIVTRKGEYFFGGAWKMGGFFNDAWPDYMWVPYSLTPSTDPDDDGSNPQVDIRWIENHLLVPGGRDDPSAHAGRVDPAPSIRPSGTPSPRSSTGAGSTGNTGGGNTGAGNNGAGNSGGGNTGGGNTGSESNDPRPWPTSTATPTPTSTSNWPWPWPTSTGNAAPAPAPVGPAPVGPAPAPAPAPGSGNSGSVGHGPHH